MTTPTQTRLRLVPTPRWDPFDDGDPAPAAAAPSPGVQGTLALAFTLPGGLPERPEPPPLRLLAGGLAGATARPEPAPMGDDAALDHAFGPQATSRAALPDPQVWTARMAQAVIEVLAGDRPASQLVRWTTADVYDGVRRRIRARPRSGSASPRAAVQSVRICEPADGVAEACAVVRRGGRYHAVALRLQGLDGRWQCTALQLG
jgi:hypothetical protein